MVQEQSPTESGNIPPDIQEAIDQTTPAPTEQAPAQSGQAQPQETPLPVLSKYERDPDNPTLDTGTDIGEAVALTNAKSKELRKKNAIGIPSDLAPRWELIVDEATSRIKAKREEIKLAIGDRPYKGIPLDDSEAERRYIEMRNDVELHTQALEPNVQKTKDGRLLVNKEYLAKLIKFESQIRKGDILT